MSDDSTPLDDLWDQVARAQAAEQFGRLEHDFARTLLFAVIASDDARTEVAAMADELAITAAQCIQVGIGDTQKLRHLAGSCFAAAGAATEGDKSTCLDALIWAGVTMGFIGEVTLDADDSDDTAASELIDAWLGTYSRKAADTEEDNG